jgi:hypothetical protein
LIEYVLDAGGWTTSLSSSVVLQRHLGTAHVVEVFSNITFWHLASLASAAGGD